MPSRKKARGKARKAAKEAKAKEAAKEEESQAVNQPPREGSSLEEQMQRLVISNDTPLKCQHGLVHISPGEEKICQNFIHAFIAVLFSQEDVGVAFATATEATKVEYAGVYISKLETVISIFLASGTQRILRGDKREAQLYATLAFYFEDFMAVNVRKTKAVGSWAKLLELESADDHTIVSYYRKRIPCACLDEKYKEVKSVKKMGWCYNPSCSLPGKAAERSKMFCCTRCGDTNYCSVECQRADWKRHKKFCDSNVEAKAVFDSI